MKIGFTGTAQGMTPQQKKRVRAALLEFGDALKGSSITELHHGDCVGADAAFDLIVRELLPAAAIVLHPCNIKHMQAHCETRGPSTRLPAKSPLERNTDIVLAVDGMIATPKEAEEQLRSGTWATIRRAWKHRRPIEIISPGGGSRAT